MNKKPRLLTPERRLHLLGYLDMLEKSKPNAACVHDKLQQITALRMHLKVSWEIDQDFEARIKRTIHRLYEFDAD